jgi:glycosyltransferase involved in cell wall biosynthesis
MAKITVLHVLADLALGGGQSIVMQHLRYADLERFDVRVASLGPDATLAPWFAEAGAPPVFIDVAAQGHLGSVVQAIEHVSGADVVHVHTELARDNVGAAALWCGVPVVFHLHSEWVHLGRRVPPGTPPLRRARKACVNRCRTFIERSTVAHYVAGSQAVATQFRPLVKQPITVLEPSVPIDAIADARAAGAGEPVRAALGIEPGARVLLSVARVAECKGHAELLEVFEVLAARHPDVVLVMVGDGLGFDWLADEVEAHPARDRIRLTGARLDVPNFLAMADVFVHASSTEAFGLVVLEAMAASLPVVAFDLPAYDDFVVPGKTAELVPKGDIGALTEAVSALLEDPYRAARLGQCGEALVRAQHPRDAVARHFEAVYTDVVARGAADFSVALVG